MGFKDKITLGIKAFGKVLGDFFSTSNAINENVVIGIVFVVVFVIATFNTTVSDAKYYTLATLVAACFTLGLLKK